MTDQLEPARFRGELVWWDVSGRGRSKAYQQKGPSPVERAILAGSRLTMEFFLGGEPYLVTLSRSDDGAYQGTWEAGRAATRRTGKAVCALKPLHASADNPHALELAGTWFEEIDWKWSGRLDPVDSLQ